MPAFTISNANVTAYPTLAEAQRAAKLAEEEPGLVITSEAELYNSPLGLGQLTEIWNGFAGVVPFDDLKPVRKFTDRKTAVARIWRAIQRLVPTESAPLPEPEHAPAVVAEKVDPPAPEAATKSTAKKTRKTPRKAAASRKRRLTSREGSKKETVLSMLRHAHGATLKQIMDATGWQPHTVRGFISTLGKHGLKIESFKRASGNRAYRLTE